MGLILLIKRSVLLTTVVVGELLNSLLIWLIIKHTPKMMRLYSRVGKWFLKKRNCILCFRYYLYFVCDLDIAPNMCYRLVVALFLPVRRRSNFYYVICKARIFGCKKCKNGAETAQKSCPLKNGSKKVKKRL